MNHRRGNRLFISSQAGEGRVSPEEVSQLFSMLSAQDTETFSRRLVTTHVQINDPDERYSLFYGTEVRARHSNNFIFSFERLMRRAQDVDSDDMIRDSILASAHGFVYRIAKPHQTNAPKELADYKITGRFINF